MPSRTGQSPLLRKIKTNLSLLISGTIQYTPIQPKKNKLAKYQEKAKSLGYPDNTMMEYQSGIAPTRQATGFPAYACMVESMDENIGRIMSTLETLDLENDTLLIFTSDNGGLCWLQSKHAHVLLTITSRKSMAL